MSFNLSASARFAGAAVRFPSLGGYQSYIENISMRI
jgi:hypothetical protein